MQPFALLVKPAGSDCNLDCKYCFYKNRPAISPAILRPCSGQACGQGLPPAQVRGLNGRQRMSDEVLEKLIKDYLEVRLDISSFIWQGGEPTLMGLDFYKKAVELQDKYGMNGQRVINSLQTNAILLDPTWCRFLHESNFLVGISIDGPIELHDYYRTDHSAAGTFEKVVRAIQCGKEHKLDFNTLTLLNDKNVEYPELLFDFLIELGVVYMQFIPCVETNKKTGEIEGFSITPHQYGEFLCRLFDRWCAYGTDKVIVRDFESFIISCADLHHTMCTYSDRCDQHIVIEHSGEVFCCDFFVEPRWRLGNIMETPIAELMRTDIKRSFATAKQNVANKCLVCRYLPFCRGGCLKHRAVFDDGSFDRESYFCQGYRKFFEHALPTFMQLGARLGATLATSQ